MRRDHRILFATAVCAVGVPASAAAWLDARTAGLATHLGATAGVPARIRQVDADLTGAIRLSDVALGDLIAADAIEASVALDSLLAGTLRADEIRVAAPRVAVQIDGDGDSDLARLARRLVQRARGDSEPGPGRLRRIVVTSGALAARIAGLGEISAAGVEIVPDAGGIRMTSDAVRLDGRTGPVALALSFSRGAAELSLPHLRLGRALAVGGAGRVSGDTGRGELAIDLHDAAVGRLASGGALELRAMIDDDGAPRPLAIDVAPREQAIAIRGERIPLRNLAAIAPRGLEVAGGHASGALVIHRDASQLRAGQLRASQLRIEIDAAVDGVAIDHRALAAGRVPLAGAIHAAFAVSPEAIAVPHAAVEVGAAHWTASGWLRRGAPGSGQLDLALAPAGCSDLLAALPGELRGPLDGLALDGTFGAELRLAVDLAAPLGEGVTMTTQIADACRAAAEPPAADVSRLTGAAEQVFPDGSRARVGRGEPGWIALHQLPAHVAAAFISAEDARFYDHAGFDVEQIARSLEIDLREHRLARGGSTISQQLVKNAFLSQRRSFDRKLQEAILTWRLEARLDKRQILERYLNIIELGPRAFGLNAAARYWFGASPRELSLRQAAFLAAMTSEPTSMSRRVRRAGGLDAESATRVDVVLRAMYRDGAIDGSDYEAAHNAPLRFAAAAVE